MYRPRFPPRWRPNYDGGYGPGPMGPPPGMMGPYGPYGPRFGPMGPMGPGPMGPGGPMGGPMNMGEGQEGGAQNNSAGGGEIWVETKTAEGKIYFYNAKTRESAWTKPEGPNVKVLTQQQVEQMAKAAQAAKQLQAGGAIKDGGGDAAEKEGGLNGDSANGDALHDAEAKMETFDGDESQQSKGFQAADEDGGDGEQGENDEASSDMPNDNSNQEYGNGGNYPPMQGPPMGGPMMHPPMRPPPMMGGPPMFRPRRHRMGGPPPFGCGPQGFGGPGYGGPPGFGGPGPGCYGGPPFGPPPGMMGPPPPFMMGPYGGPGPMGPMGGPGSMGPMSDGNDAMMNSGMNEAVTARQRSASGVVASGPPVIDAEIEAAAKQWTSHVTPEGKTYYHNAKLAKSVWEKPMEIVALEQEKERVKLVKEQEKQKKKEEKAKAEAASISGNSTAPVTNSNNTTTNNSTAATNNAGAATPAKPQDKSRPVSSTPVQGTPWCVVWTGDGKVFFFNPTSRQSVWERPPELVGRVDVDKLLAAQPGSNLETAPEIKQEEDLMGSGEPAAKKIKIEEEAAVKMETISADGDGTSIGSIGESSTNVNSSTTTTTATGSGSGNAADKVPLKPELLKESPMEAEVRAAKERATIPLEDRMKQFRDMLSEKQVSAFSTWEKELHKIVFDPRYLLLTSKERKQVFDRYVRDRAEEERMEKRLKSKMKKEDFRDLLEEAKLSSRSSFSDFAAKYAKDERFKGIEKMRERELLFNEFLVDMRRKEREERQALKERQRLEFMEMLKEGSSDLTRYSRWSDVKKTFADDARYKVIDSSSQREEWFNEFVSKLPKPRDKERDRKDRDHKDRDRKDRKDRRDRSRSRSPHRSSKDEERKRREKEKTASGDEEAAASDSEEKKREREEREKEEKERERKEREEASLREREKEVQRTLSDSLRERDKERQNHLHEEAVQNFNALLTDLVRSTDVTYHDAKKQLRKDHRYEECSAALEKDEREKLFDEHVSNLKRKKREAYRALLAETPGIDITSSFKDIKKLIKEDPRYSKFSSSERKCEKEFKEYLRDLVVKAKSEFRELLKETKSITHKSKQMIEENEQHLTDIEKVLENDRRYLVLNCVADERKELIMQYVEELERKGPPPPPTASDPSRVKIK